MTTTHKLVIIFRVVSFTALYVYCLTKLLVLAIAAHMAISSVAADATRQAEIDSAQAASTQAQNMRQLDDIQRRILVLETSTIAENLATLDIQRRLTRVETIWDLNEKILTYLVIPMILLLADASLRMIGVIRGVIALRGNT